MATGESPVEKAARCSCSAGCLSCCAQPIQPKASAVQCDSGQTPEPLSCFPLRMTKPLTGGEGTHARPSSCSINLYPAHFPALRMSRALLCAAGRVRVGSAPALATCVYEAGRAGRAPPAAPHPCPAPLPPARQAPRSDHLQRSPRVPPPVPQEMSCCRAVPRQAPEPQGRGHPQPSLHLPARAARGHAAPSRPLCAPVMCHCQRRGAQLLLGAGAHLHVYEHGGAAQVAGVHSQALPDLPDGTFDLEQLELAVREAHGSRYHPRPELICLENTHSSAGGRVLPLAYLQQVHRLAERYGLRVHMDGARLMNAAVAQAVEPAQITQHCDSVSLCFSKGLGAPAGAVLAGRRAFVAEAWRVRKLLGGGMRQAGVLAAAARVGLEQAEATLRRDHSNARRFARGIQELKSPLCSVSLPAVETNMVMVAVTGGWPSPAELCTYMRAVSEEEVAETGHAVSVLLFPWSAHTLRAVWHRDVSAHDTELALNKLGFVARKCQERLALGLGPGPPSAAGH
uniref:Aromatic amino acid beta-eliminating lyase/threonine aldolase domain-containing protein n=1 Tax=Anser brachyrhynchus TaxID=132585 RepID=A0A8B9C0V3_9AVES